MACLVETLLFYKKRRLLRWLDGAVSVDFLTAPFVSIVSNRPVQDFQTSQKSLPSESIAAWLLDGCRMLHRHPCSDYDKPQNFPVVDPPTFYLLQY